MKSKIVLSLAFLSILLVNTGCRKWLDINTNPNVAHDAPMDMLLPSAQIYTASSVGAYMNVNGELWAQHWTQAAAASQYKIYEQYAPSASDYDRPWGLFYNQALMDLQVMEDKAIASKARDYEAVAKLMKAYIYQDITDAWGDVPFSEALKGTAGILNPKYDPQEQVYSGINGLIDSARTLIKNLQAANIESNVHGDLIYAGDFDKWLKFANTLQLRVYLRLSEVAPAISQAGVAKVYAIAGGSSGFIEEGESAKIDFSETSGNQNPLYAEIVGLGKTQNLVASRTVVDSMNSGGDWRVYALFTQQSNGAVVGIPQGAYDLPASTPVSIPTAITGARALDENSATAPVIFLSDFESKFLQAEALARGWAAGNAQDLFEEGIYISFRSFEAEIASWDITLRDSLPGNPGAIFKLTADYAAYTYINGDTLTGYLEGDPVVQADASYWGQYPSSGSVQNQLRHIITQKWFCMTGLEGFEAWTEWRRTGYPDFFTYSVNSIIGNKFPVRFLYPNTELTSNAKFPGQKFVTERVWWDVN
jgi:hypothetical protein